MIGFRLSLVLDFGTGAAASPRHSILFRTDSAQRMKKGRRAAVPPSVPPLPEDLGWGPLEAEGRGREFGAPERSRGARP